MAPRLHLVKPDKDIPLQKYLIDHFGKRYGGRVWRRITSRIGEEPLAPIGGGLMGVAYPTPSGNILKVTRDWSELYAMSRLMDELHPNIVEVHDVFIVRGNGEGVGIVYRADVPTTLEEYDPELGVWLDNLIERADDDFITLRNAGIDTETALFRSMRGIIIELEEHAAAKDDPLLEDYAEAIQLLSDMGIYGIDFSAGNVGIETSPEVHGVIFDIGNSEVRAVPVAVLGKKKLGQVKS